MSLLPATVWETESASYLGWRLRRKSSLIRPAWQMVGCLLQCGLALGEIGEIDLLPRTAKRLLF